MTFNLSSLRSLKFFAMFAETRQTPVLTFFTVTRAYVALRRRPITKATSPFESPNSLAFSLEIVIVASDKTLGLSLSEERCSI